MTVPADHKVRLVRAPCPFCRDGEDGRCAPARRTASGARRSATTTSPTPTRPRPLCRVRRVPAAARDDAASAAMAARPSSGTRLPMTTTALSRSASFTCASRSLRHQSARFARSSAVRSRRPCGEDWIATNPARIAQRPRAKAPEPDPPSPAAVIHSTPCPAGGSPAWLNDWKAAVRQNAPRL